MEDDLLGTLSTQPVSYVVDVRDDLELIRNSVATWSTRLKTKEVREFLEDFFEEDMPEIVNSFTEMVDAIDKHIAMRV